MMHFGILNMHDDVFIFVFLCCLRPIRTTDLHHVCVSGPCLKQTFVKMKMKSNLSLSEAEVRARLLMQVRVRETYRNLMSNS